ncbi:MAG: hypothetical protein KC766_03675 [Myxococcales bacterium]|nr:hypothetical protein [Myxococcales bacterium]
MLAGLTLWLGACGIVTIKPASAGTETEASRNRAARYDGPECYQVLYTPDESRERHERQTDESAASQVLLATCSRSEYRGQEQEPKIAAVRFIDYYDTYDDRSSDPILLAATAINEHYSLHGGGGVHMGGRTAPALIALLVGPLDDSQLTKALASVQVPEDARQAFLTNFREAKSYFTHETNQLEGAYKELLVDVPKQVQARRQTQFEAQADNWATLDSYADRIKEAASSQGGDPGLLQDLRVLRAKVVESSKDDYIKDPLFARLTREIALQYALAQDAASLAAERRVFRRDFRNQEPFPETLAAEVYYAQLSLLNEFRSAKEKFRKAKDAGLDDATAKARAGREFIDFTPGDLKVPSETDIPEYEKLLDKKREAFPFQEVVDGIKPDGDGVVVSFKKTPVETFEYYGCYKTGRIQRISSDGRLEYETHCNTRPKTVMHENVKPLKFPADEAKQLKRGTKIRGVSVGGEGRVVWLIEKDEIVSERGYPVPHRPANPKAKN